MKELRFATDEALEAARDIQREMRERAPKEFKPIPKVLAVLDQESNEFLALLADAGVEYQVAHEFKVPDSHFLVEAEG